MQFDLSSVIYLTKLSATEKPLKCNEENAASFRKHSHNQTHADDKTGFSLIGNCK